MYDALSPWYKMTLTWVYFMGHPGHERLEELCSIHAHTVIMYVLHLHV